jgi:NTP pyrophosphatase (non-canonical NTP hydrolase)
MNFNDYQSLASTTAIYPSSVKLIYPTLGLCGEAGEVAEKMKKLFRDSQGDVTEDFKTALKKELGDVLWYLSAVASDLGLTLEEIAVANYEKLQDRQNRGVLHGSGDNR